VSDAIRVVSPGGSLGYGVNEESLERAVKMGLSVIGADSGSTDMGPYYLGTGIAYHSRATMKRDITLILEAGRKHGIPVLIGNAGGAGGDPHLRWARDIIEEIAAEKGLSFKLALVHSEQGKDYLRERVQAGKVTPMPGVPELTVADVDACDRIVGQMGVEPFIAAMQNGAEVVLAGRSCDSAIFGAFPISRGIAHGPALHMGKILECGAMSAVPPTGRDCLVSVMNGDGFEIIAPNPAREVTPFSVAAHMVYEVEHPFLQGEPEGVLDFSAVTFEETGRRSTRVQGTLFHAHPKPTIRFEGSQRVGFRSVVIGGIRDPFLISRLDEFIAGCTEQTMGLSGRTDVTLNWIVYGRDGVMGEMEPLRDKVGHEVGIVAQVLGPTQEAAHDVGALLEARMIGFTYTGAKTRTANIAFPFSPLVTDTGPVYRFGVLHVAELREPGELTSLFPIEYVNVGSR
jgi:rRNA processing protein Gar1